MSSQITNAAFVEPPNYRSRVLLAGYGKSGKTSCQRVVFDGMLPKDTFLGIKKTHSLEKRQFDTILPIEILDSPEDLSVDVLRDLLPELHAIIFVIDINDQWYTPVTTFGDIVVTVSEELRSIGWEEGQRPFTVHVFIHKMETISNETKMLIAKYNDLQRRMSEELFDLGVGYIQPVFHPTSIYDHTIYQAWSEVIMSLIPPFVLGEYDNLINFMHLNSNTKYAFLFDSKACLRISANQESHEAMTFSLSCEYLKLLTSMSQVIGKSLREGDPDDLHSSQLELTETVVSCWRITDNLCLVAGMSHDVWHELRGVIDYNVLTYRDALLQALEVIEMDRRGSA